MPIGGKACLLTACCVSWTSNSRHGTITRTTTPSRRKLPPARTIVQRDCVPAGSRAAHTTLMDPPPPPPPTPLPHAGVVHGLLACARARVRGLKISKNLKICETHNYGPILGRRFGTVRVLNKIKK